MKHVCIIGAGQIGSRHLQALKKVRIPLRVTVVDPVQESLDLAKNRYHEVIGADLKHEVSFLRRIPDINGDIDIAIISTSSDVRCRVVEELLNKFTVSYLILEKLLFQNKKDYFIVEHLLNKKSVIAWVNCYMRTIPFYSDLKDVFTEGPIQYLVTGSNYGLITNAIHYVDQIAYLTGTSNFKVNTSLLNDQLIQSKRKGFYELYGTLQLYFEDGSIGILVCYEKGSAPFIVEIRSSKVRCLSMELESKALISNERNNWKWYELETNIQLQSIRTTQVIEDILNNGVCQLTPYDQSAKMHLTLLEEIIKFINKHNDEKLNYYPFT